MGVSGFLSNICSCFSKGTNDSGNVAAPTPKTNGNQNYVITQQPTNAITNVFSNQAANLALPNTNHNNRFTMKPLSTSSNSGNIRDIRLTAAEPHSKQETANRIKIDLDINKFFENELRSCEEEALKIAGKTLQDSGALNNQDIQPYLDVSRDGEVPSLTDASKQALDRVVENIIEYAQKERANSTSHRVVNFIIFKALADRFALEADDLKKAFKLANEVDNSLNSDGNTLSHKENRILEAAGFIKDEVLSVNPNINYV